MTQNTDQTISWTHYLGSYSLAAGALGAIALPAQSAEQAFSPIGGLPISVNDTTTSVDLDIDGDMVADFRVSTLR